MKKKNGLGERPQNGTSIDDTRSGDCQPDRPAECIYCKARRVWWIGFHERAASKLVDDEVVHVTGLISRRARCAECRDSWIVRLLEIFPGRHFQLEIVAEALARYLFDASATQATVASWAKCAQRTLRRWIAWIGAVASPQALVARLMELAGDPVRLKCPPVTEEVRKAKTEPRRRTLSAAAWNLGLLEGIGSSLGLQPPGLRSVLLWIVGDRAAATTDARPALPEFARSLI